MDTLKAGMEGLVMEPIDVGTPVGQLVTERPRLARIFDKLGIDYCCGGRTPLQEACEARGLDPASVVQTINAFAATDDAEGDGIDWSKASLTDLCDHIEQTHHQRLRDDLPRLTAYVDTVAKVHGAEHPKLLEVQSVFSGLVQELLAHIAEEEQKLFPVIRRLEQGDHGALRELWPSAGVASKAFGPTESTMPGPVAGLIQRMEAEHDATGAALASIRHLTDEYAVPQDACAAYRTMLADLERLESETHQHVHKENNILFPRAIAKERTLIVDLTARSS